MRVEPLPVKEDVNEKIAKLISNIELAIKGKGETIKQALTTLFARGHLLIEDVPGIGKTTLAQALARSLGCSFHRIQFTSDLLPSDILGVSIFNQAKAEFEFKKGPIFANMVLADEINRATPKTQSSLLESMSEYQVSIDNTSYQLPSPFMVIATQNPREHYGTYPLPESQMDRFLMRIQIGYPEAEVEKDILFNRRLEEPVKHIQPIISGEEIIAIQHSVEAVQMEPALLDYLMAIINETRHSAILQLGASTRGGLYLYRTAQAHALLDRRAYCLPDDIKDMVIPVLAHRVVVADHFESLAQARRSAEQVLEEILHKIPIPY